MRSDLDRVQDILEAIERVQRHTAGGRAAFDADELIQVWVVRHLQIIGEAARRLSDDAYCHSHAGNYQAISVRRRAGNGRRSATLNTVTGQLAYVEHAWSLSHFTVVSQYLPKLLGDAQVVVLTTSAADQVAAHRVLVVAYRLVSSIEWRLWFGCTKAAGR